MATLSAEAKSLIAEIHPGLVATASKTGQPNVSAKGTFRVLDDEHVLFADVNSPRTMANLAENPQVSVLILDSGHAPRFAVSGERPDPSWTRGTCSIRSAANSLPGRSSRSTSL